MSQVPMQTNSKEQNPMSASSHPERHKSILLPLLIALIATTVFALRPSTARAQTTVPATTEVAIAKDRYVAIYNDATGTKPRIRLDAYRNFSHRLVFRVLSSDEKRYRVSIPIRPNGATGYIDKTNITLTRSPYYLRVSLSQHNVVVYKDGKEMLRETVAVGKKSTPTPVGVFYLSELAKVKNKGSEYGPWAFGVAAFSPKITRFKGGSGQIGFHGTNKPKDLGKDVSHGCIRISNATIAKLAKILPQGTPFEVVA
jgi:lipoprotein-anchoring transpeptidase ErfK/SrfK